jgi:F-type H+-transporting ATPase subunit a
MSSPLHQFVIQPIIPLEIAGYDVSLTNSGLAMILAAVSATAFVALGMQKQAVIPGRLQAAVEIVYSTISKMVSDTAGPKSKPYFPLIFSIFIFILFCNVLGMFPGSFTPTSHILVTFALAILVFLTVMLVGLFKHGLHFFTLFLPHGTPWWLVPVIVPLEIFSFLVRPFSLSIRLFANMMAGHIVLKIFAGMAVSLFLATGFAPALLPLPVLFNAALIGFEFFVAGLQAYIFSILAAVYMHDALELH